MDQMRGLHNKGFHSCKDRMKSSGFQMSNQYPNGKERACEPQFGIPTNGLS
jgi:hypothetical protein